MAKKFSELPSLSWSEIAGNDLVSIEDFSASESAKRKSITATNLRLAAKKFEGASLGITATLTNTGMAQNTWHPVEYTHVLFDTEGVWLTASPYAITIPAGISYVNIWCNFVSSGGQTDHRIFSDLQDALLVRGAATVPGAGPPALGTLIRRNLPVSEGEEITANYRIADVTTHNLFVGSSLTVQFLRTS